MDKYMNEPSEVEVKAAKAVIVAAEWLLDSVVRDALSAAAAVREMEEHLARADAQALAMEAQEVEFFHELKNRKEVMPSDVRQNNETPETPPREPPRFAGHTPGPWVAEDNCTGKAPDAGCAVIASNKKSKISNPTRGIVAWATRHVGQTSAEVKANARLIAAAPELVTEVERLQRQLCEAEARMRQMKSSPQKR